MSDTAKYKTFAQALVALIREHNVHATDISFTLRGHDVGPFEQARMTYNQGRHGSTGTINLIVTTHFGNFQEELPA